MKRGTSDFANCMRTGAEAGISRTPLTHGRNQGMHQRQGRGRGGCHQSPSFKRPFGEVGFSLFSSSLTFTVYWSKKSVMRSQFVTSWA